MQALRLTLRQKRRAINHSNREKLAKRLLSQTQRLVTFKHGQKIAIYLPNDGEIDTKYIYNFLKRQGFSIYLPILVNKSLKFSKINKHFKKNIFSIKEPVFTQILSAKQINIIFMPLVGFDKNKNRIGMGGGFYDRTLTFKKPQQNYKNPKLYGLAFDCQKVYRLNANPWDVPLNAIITPTAIYTK
ncbi:5-formyltetrahydrofolate cyclo-ligase [Candidatus Ruthia magnifica str. Cm (Calyptogena magnifica)]|uniref:5-formyltetrahydrofolate cyclo-ligase n=1 Tax=Ruthia magnifica subsp. Calyptogena magnifica TaxID=413404 RepID=A1AXM1_RUTMC|nr:5-formyltetrahydrofolate cyclo-ligase [Candidatus Ruthturnera calyptogenae]ABL02678.1 5-formyltetrahydrofolate cyclo-ligase [Candidatus Ruthia magnifica str. Cm (Calyptogena magnifica)]